MALSNMRKPLIQEQGTPQKPSRHRGSCEQGVEERQDIAIDSMQTHQMMNKFTFCRQIENCEIAKIAKIGSCLTRRRSLVCSRVPLTELFLTQCLWQRWSARQRK